MRRHPPKTVLSRQFSTGRGMVAFVAAPEAELRRRFTTE
jgi:hypothetical protein